MLYKRKVIKYLMIIIGSLLLVACGEQNNNFDPNHIIKYDKNVTKSVNYLKREYGDRYITTYIADNEEDIFVYVHMKNTDYSNDYSLFHYSITTSVKPKLANTVVDQNSVEIIGIDFLLENKIIYVRADYKGYQAYVCIYDYKQKKEIKRYDLSAELLDSKRLIVSENQCFFTLYSQASNEQDIIVDISEIYDYYKCQK